MRIRAVLPFFACASVVAIASATVTTACKEPTEILVQVSTDVACPQPLTATVTAGAPGASLETHDPTSTAYACDPRTLQIGSVVIVPSGAKDADIGVRVVLGIDTQADKCKPPEYKGCIVARRELKFLPGATLTLPVVMRGDCKDLPCDANTTCFHGTCVSSQIDSNACPNATCGEGQLDAGGAPADGGASDAPADTIADAPVIDSPIADAPADAPGCTVGCTTSSLALGIKHTCVARNGNAVCFGGNDYGQLGRGSVSSAAFPDPSPVLTGPGAKLTGVTGVVSGDSTSCVFTSNGNVYCWGDTSNGQLGPTAAQSANGNGQVVYAVEVPEMRGAKLIAMGITFTCWADSNSNVKCMGTGPDGEIGDGNLHPTAVGPTPVSTGGPVATLIASDDNTCATLVAGGIVCWGGSASTSISSTTFNVTSPSPPTASGLVAIAPGSVASCGLSAGGEVECWGRNNEGVAGHGPIDDSGANPAPVGGVITQAGPLAMGRQVAIAIGHVNDSQLHMHACAILADAKGTVYCWGDNEYGQLGAGDFNEGVNVGSISNVAVPVTGSTGFPGAQRVVIGGHHSCAIDTSGAVWCWGRNSDGQLGVVPDAGLAPSPRPLHVTLP